MRYLPQHPYYVHTNKEMAEYITRRDKCKLLLNGVEIDKSYLSILGYIFENLTAPWTGNKEFFEGSMNQQEYIKHMSGIYKTPLKGRLSIIDCDGNILKYCDILTDFN